MAIEDVQVGLICNCGHNFTIPVAGQQLETVKFTCPACGKVDGFTPDQIAQLVAGHSTVAGQVDDALKKATKGSKILQYRPKR